MNELDIICFQYQVDKEELIASLISCRDEEMSIKIYPNQARVLLDALEIAGEQ